MTDRSLIFPQQQQQVVDAKKSTMGLFHDDESFGGYSSMDESDDESLSLHSFCEDMFLVDTPSPIIESAKSSQSSQQQVFDVTAMPASTSPSLSPLNELLGNLDNEEDSTMDLFFPITNERDFRSLIDAIRSNSTVSECGVSDECFQSLTPCQKRELVFTISEIPSLKCLILDSIFPEFLYTLNCCRCWKRDQHYQQYQRYCDFENRTVEVLQLRNIPSDIYEGVLGNTVVSAMSLFASLQRLDLTFSSEFDGEQAVLTRVALAALQNSKSLRDVKLGFEDDFDGGYTLVMEADTTRNEGIMRVLKLRCGYDNLSDQCYADLSQMLKMNSRTLQGLVLDTPVDNPLVLANTLGQNTNLKALCLGTFDCQEKASKEGLLELVSQVLNPQSDRALEYLSLVCQDMDDQGIEQMSKALSKSNLRELMLFLDNDIDGVVSSQGISALAKVFEVNETIEEFNLICHSLDDEGLLAFAKALKVNDGTLRKLKLQVKSSRGLQVTASGYKAMIDMLQTNTTLEMFEIRCCPGSEEEEDNDDDDFFDFETEAEAAHDLYQPEIDYYLNLNKSGVRDCQLNIDATPEEFKTLVVAHRQDLNTLYYMLSTNPSFVAFAT